MEEGELREWHGSELNHAGGFEECGSLRGGGFGADGGEVEVLARGEDVVADEPVAGDDFVEP
jgi:hypothetical protein